tara:strand:+ start:102553 stop:104808 length:2256 start_codon:yes stop_codon:yes gene_type:complete
MAKDNEASARNEAFLRQLEIQRLNKPCNRIIDLRGKVAGECQAYTFGDRIHYLDDRAYLLAKQLLDRFNGRYTMGVYDSLLKALKMLDQQQKKATFATNKEILHQAPLQPQYIPFDQILQRKEPRIVYASPIDIIIADVLYHGSTIDITSSAIRVTLRRAHTIEQDDDVSVTFSGLSSLEEPQDITNLLSKITYKVVQIEHNEKYTYAILVRNRDDNSDVTTWFDNWTQKHNNPSHTDLDDSIFNLASRYYLRLFIRSLNIPLLWLSHSDDLEPIKAFHLMLNDNKILKYLNNGNHEADLSLLPINKIMTSGDSYLVVIFKDNDILKSIAVPRSKPDLIAKALNWHQQQQHSHVLLLQPAKQRFDPEMFDDELAFISNINQHYGNELSRRLSSITQTIAIIDMSSVCLNINSQAIFSKHELSLFSVVNSVQVQLPIPTSFKYYIQRNHPRFFVNTQITAHIGEQIFTVSTLDLSIDGLSLHIPNNINIPQDTRITIDFTRWQNQTNKHDLTGISYLVRNKIVLVKGQTRLGLQRLSHLSPVSINHFFESVIERNKDKLAINNRDLIADKETSIYRRLLPATISSIPFYFGLDSNQKRILQAIATTQFNHADQYDSLWRALAKMVVPLSEIIKNQSSGDNSGVNFGMYCYQNKSKNNDWVVNTDFDFSFTAGKELFISRAMANEHYVFFQCSLMPIPLNTLDNEDDLKTQLLALRNQSPHKVKQIREILYGLFGIGNLVDVTDILAAAYKKN